MIEAVLIPNSFITDINRLNQDYPYRSKSCIHIYLKENKSFKWYLNCILKEQKEDLKVSTDKRNERK